MHSSAGILLLLPAQEGQPVYNPTGLARLAAAEDFSLSHAHAACGVCITHCAQPAQQVAKDTVRNQSSDQQTTLAASNCQLSTTVRESRVSQYTTLFFTVKQSQGLE
jgi:phosphopantetheinyl transferase